MRTTLSMRVVCGSAAVTLFLSHGFEAAVAHGGPSFGAPAMRPAMGHGFGHGLRPHFSDAGRVSQSFRGRDGLRRFDRFASFNRFGRNRFFRYGNGFFDSGFWYGPYTYGDASAAPGGGGGGPVIVVVGAPSFNDFPAAVRESNEPSPEGGCMIHKLTYDSAGHYVGERQTPAC